MSIMCTSLPRGGRIAHLSWETQLSIERKLFSSFAAQVTVAESSTGLCGTLRNLLPRFTNARTHMGWLRGSALSASMRTGARVATGEARDFSRTSSLLLRHYSSTHISYGLPPSYFGTTHISTPAGEYGVGCRATRLARAADRHGLLVWRGAADRRSANVKDKINGSPALNPNGFPSNAQHRRSLNASMSAAGS